MKIEIYASNKPISTDGSHVPQNDINVSGLDEPILIQMKQTNFTGKPIQCVYRNNKDQDWQINECWTDKPGYCCSTHLTEFGIIEMKPQIYEPEIDETKEHGFNFDLVIYLSVFYLFACSYLTLSKYLDVKKPIVV
jgi:hypothetical protein